MFKNCSSLAEIDLPSSLTEIGHFSFYKCTSLTKITIPISVNKIGKFAFSGCTSLLLSSLPFPESTELIELGGEKSSINRINETVENYLKDRKEIYQSLLSYLESQEEKTEDLIQLIRLFNDKNVIQSEFSLIELLNLLSQISFNHVRTSDLINKTENILSIYQEEIKKLANNKIYQIFRKNNRILLFLFEKGILKMDNSIINNMDGRSQMYFSKEITYFKLKGSETYPSYLDEEKFKKRQIDLNDSEVCQLIRSDSLEEFISFVNATKEKKNKMLKKRKIISQNENPFASNIPRSIYEMDNITFIGYAAYHGSIKIFNFLLDNIKNYNFLSLWMNAIQGNKMEIIHILENKGIKPSNKPNHSNNFMSSYLAPGDCFNCAIKCHHNEIAQYIQTNYKVNSDYSESLKHYNFNFIDSFYDTFKDKNSFILCNLCSNDYPKFAQILIDSKNIDINEYASQHNLSQNTYNVQSDKMLIILEAIKSCREILNYFIEEKGFQIEFDNSTLFKAISNEDIELLKIILGQSNININETINENFEIGDEYCDSLSPLFLAITKQNIKIVRLLLKYPSIDVNLSVVPNGSRTTEWTALHLAILYENIPIIKLLLNESNIDVNIIANFDETTYRFTSWSSDNHFDQYYTPLHEAIELDNIEIVKLLLDHPKTLVNKIEIYDTYPSKYKGSFQRVKQTALCRAIQKNDLELVKLLLDRQDIDVNKPAVLYKETSDDNYNENIDDFDENDENIIRKTPLQFAYEFHSEEIIQLLLSRSDIEKIDAKEEENDDGDNSNSAFAFIEYIS